MLIFQVNPGRVSIHAPVKGRLLRWAGWSGGGRFNPRPREGAT